jgi:hypothetical protein
MNGWLEEDGWNADTATLKEKLSELTNVGDSAFWRSKEMIERPDIVKKAKEMTLQTDAALVNISKERSWLNKSHIEVNYAARQCHPHNFLKLCFGLGCFKQDSSLEGLAGQHDRSAGCPSCPRGSTVHEG